MDDIYAIRRRNLQQLLDSPKFLEVTKEVDRAVMLGISPSMFSQLKNPGYKIGAPMARKIEEKQQLERGWMDQQAGSHSERLDPGKVIRVFRALTVILKRRDPDAVIDLGDIEDAELFSQAYAEYAPHAYSTEGEAILGATVTELLAKREAVRHARRGGGRDALGGDDGKEAGEAVPGTEAQPATSVSSRIRAKAGPRRGH